MISEVILRRFWPLVVIGLVALGGLLYLVISTLSGASQVWASLVTVAAVVGAGGWGLGSGVSHGVRRDRLRDLGRRQARRRRVEHHLAARVAGQPERAGQLERRGVAMPQIRKNLDVQ